MENRQVVIDIPERVLLAEKTDSYLSTFVPFVSLW